VRPLHRFHASQEILTSRLTVVQGVRRDFHPPRLLVRRFGAGEIKDLAISLASEVLISDRECCNRPGMSSSADVSGSIIAIPSGKDQ